MERSSGSSTSNLSVKSRPRLSRAACSSVSIVTTIEHVLKEHSICTSVNGDEDASDDGSVDEEKAVQPEVRHMSHSPAADDCNCAYGGDSSLL